MNYDRFRKAMTAKAVSKRLHRRLSRLGIPTKVALDNLKKLSYMEKIYRKYKTGESVKLR